VLLAEPDEPVAYRIDRVWPAGGRVILAAQRKAGKTTCTGNLLRSLADGDPFLGRYAVTPVEAGGTVFAIDTEMSRRMLRAWLADQKISHPERIHVEPLRGTQGAQRLHARLAQLGIAGGAVYDALVAATAAEHGITLATRDRRAAETYRALSIDFQLID
jgi:hypothetical protein